MTKFLIVLISAAWVSIFGPAAHAAKPKDTLILYGGFAYLDPTTQPLLDELLFSEEQHFVEPGDGLIDAVSKGLESSFDRSALRKWTSYGIVTTRDELDAALQVRLERAPLISDRDRFFETFEAVYAIVLIGALEINATEETDTPHDGQPVFNHWELASVTAALFDLKSGELVLSATGIGYDSYAGTAIETLPVTERAISAANAYKMGAQRAVEALSALTRKTSQSARLRRATAETFGVAQPIIMSQVTPVRDAFQHRGFSGFGDDYCEPVRGCAEDDQRCNALEALLAHGMTMSLSKAGLSTIPPFHWSRWRAGVSYQTKLRVGLDSYSGLAAPLNRLRFDQSVDAAQIKVNPLFVAADSVSEITDNGYSEIRTWSVDLRYKLFETAENNCSTITKEMKPFPSYTPEGNGVAGPGTKGLVGRRANSVGLDQMLIMLSLVETFEGQMVAHLDAVDDLRKEAE
jgi:hypothetical protein